MLDKLKKLLKKQPQEPKKERKLSAKESADKKGEPYIEILSMEIDPADPSNGAFELDWNDKFLANLVRAGYQGKTDADIVDNWFKAVCRNVVLETWEQDQADPEKRMTNRKNIGGGRTEVS